MAGSITEILTSHPAMSFKKLSLAFTCTAGGAVSGIKTTKFDGGEILRIAYIPGTIDVGGDISLIDPDDKDVLLTLGTDWGATPKNIVPITGDGTRYLGRVFAEGPLTLTVASGGNATSGELIIYWR